MDKFWQMVLAVVASIGGIGAIFVAVVHFSSNIIAERLQKKYDLKLNEEFEKFKAGIDNKKYISKAKFEVEFSVYRDLSKAFFKMVMDVNTMIPEMFQHVPSDEAEREKFELENYQRAKDSIMNAQDALNSNAPFIPEAVFKKYDAVMKLCTKQLITFELRWESVNWTSDGQKEMLPVDAYKRTSEINEKFEELNNRIREYLNSLDVLN